MLFRLSILEGAVIRHDPSFQVVIDDSLALWNFMICWLTGVWCFPYSMLTSEFCSVWMMFHFVISLVWSRSVRWIVATRTLEIVM